MLLRVAEATNGIVVACLLAGCAATRPVEYTALKPNEVRFRRVAILDYRYGNEPDVAAILQPGDLIVNYMSLGRSAKERQWLFAVLPYGHAMIVLDPADLATGLFECRFRGCRRIELADLRRYSFSIVYRLDDAEKLDFDRLRAFAAYAQNHCTSYSFRSWLGINGNLTPANLDELSPYYTCSTFAVAAYHHAGATLSVADHPHRVITPLSLAASTATWNENARGEGNQVAIQRK